MDVQKFKSDFDSCGMTQKEYSKHIGISSSMVSYYLKKARAESITLPQEQLASFSKLILAPSAADKQITIITPDGTQINIPI